MLNLSNKINMNLINSLKWRYATKKMDASKKVNPEDIQRIREAVQLAASSYGLQPYKILEIENPDLREQLQALCWNQSQVTEASHLFLFCNYLTVSDKDVDEFVKLKAQVQDTAPETLKPYSDFVQQKLAQKTADEHYHWTAKQSYIALANAMMACAELQIDSTPMEGFEREKVDELLNLKEQGLSAAVFLAVGYRSSEDSNQDRKKVRKALSDLFKKI